MRVLVLIGGVLCASTMAMADSPQKPIAKQPTVHHQANVSCCSQVYVTHRSPVVRSTTPVVRSTTPVVRSATPVVRSTTPVVRSATPVVRSTTGTHAQQPQRYIMHQAPAPAVAPAPPAMQYQPRTYNRYPTQRGISIDRSRFPRFQSWTEM